ncbi:hypothetical protein DSO57_1006112 [Entomophthora muscae]|uniref:Uncharacterized protein n=1 Tax=Entomophthora muscae TaxID=34485 RepID=A0ACC2TJN0_9FUNG|nr:hypothetical protein DSO57_1006112 [Entomophthora muscae]
MISFRKDKTIADFSDRLYLETQILTGSGSLTKHVTHIALCAAVKPYEALYQTLIPAFQDKCTLDGMVICHRCNRKGHYVSSCNSKTGIHTLPPLEPEVQGKVNVE